MSNKNTMSKCTCFFVRTGQGAYLCWEWGVQLGRQVNYLFFNLTHQESDLAFDEHKINRRGETRTARIEVGSPCDKHVFIFMLLKEGN